MFDSLVPPKFVPTARNLFLLAILLSSSLGLPRVATASPYQLPDLGLFSEPEIAALKGVGIERSDQLLVRVAVPKDRHELAAALKGKLAPTQDRLLQWARWCDLLQVPGIGPTMVRLMQAAGVVDSADLAKRKPADLAPLLDRVNAQKKISGKTPSEQHLVAWIAAASKLTITIKSR